MICRASAGLILRIQGRPTNSLSLRYSKSSRQHHQQGRIGLIGLTIGEMCGNWVVGKNPWNKHVPQFSLETQDIKGPGVAYFYHHEMHFGSERPETVIRSWKLWAKKWTFNCGSWTKCPRLTDSWNFAPVWPSWDVGLVSCDGLVRLVRPAPFPMMMSSSW